MSQPKRSKRYRYRFYGMTLPAELPVAQAPNGAELKTDPAAE